VTAPRYTWPQGRAIDFVPRAALERKLREILADRERRRRAFGHTHWAEPPEPTERAEGDD
jgi:hypothetical protein